MCIVFPFAKEKDLRSPPQIKQWKSGIKKMFMSRCEGFRCKVMRFPTARVRTPSPRKRLILVKYFLKNKINLDCPVGELQLNEFYSKTNKDFSVLSEEKIRFKCFPFSELVKNVFLSFPPSYLSQVGNLLRPGEKDKRNRKT